MDEYETPHMLATATAAATPCPPWPAPMDRTNIVFWHAMSGQLGDTLTGIVNEFNTSQSGRDVVQPVYKGAYRTR